MIQDPGMCAQSSATDEQTLLRISFCQFVHMRERRMGKVCRVRDIVNNFQVNRVNTGPYYFNYLSNVLEINRLKIESFARGARSNTMANSCKPNETMFS